MNLTLMAMLLISSVVHQQETALGQKAQLDQEIKIKPGQEVLVDNLKIKFDSVPKDNRCLCGEECSRRLHTAVVLLRLGSPEGEGKYAVFNTSSESNEALSRAYRVSLIRLDPCPEPNRDINRNEYEATLLVTKRADATQGANPRGESKPDFSGTWSHMAAVDAGSTLTISHRGSQLSVTRSSAAMARRFITENIYYIDGRAHTTTQTEYYENRSTDRKQGYKTSEVRSIVRWDGDRIVNVEGSGKEVWELSEDGKQLILTTGTTKLVYKKI